MGNSIVLKPSELTPHTSRLIETMLAALFPADEVAVVTGGPDVGARFSELAFDHLVFTGSTAIGRQVMQAAGKHLVPLTLELGGKSPAVMARGAVNARNVKSVAFGKLSNAGQTCIAPDYLLVHQDDLASFMALYDAAVKSFYPDGPTGDDYGAIINDRHYRRLQALLADAQARGAQLHPVGHRPDSASERPNTLAPTLIVGAPDDSAIMQEEIFGPLLPVRTYAAFDETIDVINAAPRPLALYYFGPPGEDRDRLLARTASGNVSINATLLHFAQDDLPFGGIGPSGMGACHGIEGFRALSHAKGVFIQSRWRFTDLLRAPFGKRRIGVVDEIAHVTEHQRRRKRRWRPGIDGNHTDLAPLDLAEDLSERGHVVDVGQQFAEGFEDDGKVAVLRGHGQLVDARCALDGRDRARA